MKYCYSGKEVCNMEIEIAMFVVKGSAQLTVPPIVRSRSKLEAEVRNTHKDLTLLSNQFNLLDSSRFSHSDWYMVTREHFEKPNTYRM